MYGRCDRNELEPNQTRADNYVANSYAIREETTYAILQEVKK